MSVAIAVDVTDSLIEFVDDHSAQRPGNPAGELHVGRSRLVRVIKDAIITVCAADNESQQVGPHYRLDHRITGHSLRLASGDVGANYFG